jgi:outer membrane protein
MKRIFAIVTLVASGLALGASAQAPATATAPKVAVIQFQDAVTNTNEFQRDFGDLQKKFEPQRAQLKSLSDEVDALTKQLSAPGITEADRANKSRTLDEKKKQAQRMLDDAQTDYQQQMQDLFGKVAAKVDEVLNSYSKEQGYTLVIDASENQQQAPLVLYAAPSVNITKTIIDAYNVKSGVPAPPPSAPSAQAPAAPRTAAPKPAAKPATQP